MPENSPHIFGVCHLSPAAAWHLRQLLDRVRPKLVLIEGSDDADDLIPHIVSPKSTLPIAILAYTANAPVRKLFIHSRPTVRNARRSSGVSRKTK